MRTVSVVLVVAALVVAGCSDDGGDVGDDAATTSAPVPVPATGAVEQISEEPTAEPAPGRAVVVLGTSVVAELETTTCTIESTAADGDGATALVTIDAAGEDESGAEVNLAVRRFRSEAVTDTITDTVTVATGDVDAPDLALVAQRFEVDGVVTDPRDADADDPLVRVVGDRVEVDGVFAPPGAFAVDGGLVRGVVRVTCP